ncbi:unnamed protein product [Heligmosomoides polygyrus]|uniref:Endo/exonuclease/phosphatase domain-containing protein n=1 Tax=Heligmosomoides polygyrus TaxID=6339 RepID=A0A183FSR4_HELPZ|nr:unnamed protein product [Heligmosomoides polygyrus]
MNRTRGAGAKSTTGYTAKMFTPKRGVTVASWNVRTAYQVVQKEIIAREFVRYKVNFAALSELRLTGSDEQKYLFPTETLRLFYSSGDKHTEGVGFALDENAVNCVLAFHPISSRIAVLTLSGTTRTDIFSVPTEIGPDDAKDDFYNSLRTAIDLVSKTDVILIAGNFNARVGRNRSGWEEVLGRHGVGEVNDNGVRLLTFAAANGLLIGNSIFQHRQIHQLTWRTPNGTDSALLDYVLINRQFRTSISDVRVKRGADCGSDHHLVCARMLRLQKARGSTKRIIRRN